VRLLVDVARTVASDGAAGSRSEATG
jgi:hypothetical protein